MAFPTETVYGLGADALNGEAVASVYRAKGRPSDNPMIVHIAKVSDMQSLTPSLSQDMRVLMEAFWPGPLTIVVQKKPEVPDVTTGGLDTVAVRMPDSKPALDLIEMSGTPIAAPSANISGRPSPTRARDVVADMDGRIEAVIDGEDCRVGIESTVIDMTGDVPTVLRPGILTAEEISRALGKPVKYDDALLQKVDLGTLDPEAGAADAGDFKPKSPGMKYKHYAPNAEMYIIQGKQDDVKTEIERRRALCINEGKSAGVILFEEEAFVQAAHDFFAKLRDLDNEGVDVILAGALSDENGVGFAVMNRMLKSAGYNIINV